VSQDLVELFQELDDNKDGLVTFEEFLNGLRLFKEEEEEGGDQSQSFILLMAQTPANHRA